MFAQPRLYRFIFTLAFGFFAALVWAAPANAATFTVTNVADSGAGSLRQALNDANATSGIDTITFSIGSGYKQIIPTSPIPPIIHPVIVDATTQPGYAGAPLIELSGQGAGAGAVGVRITGGSGGGSGSTIKGLIINRFSANGIFLDSSDNIIQNNYIGTTADGMGGAGNGTEGVAVFSSIPGTSSNNNTIGGTNASQRNVISGNRSGVVINAQDGGTTTGNVILGNYIGTNAAGTGGIGNAGDGVLFNDSQGVGNLTNNTIGGTSGTTPGGACTGACNLISGNGANGVGVWHSDAQNNSIIGNFIGTDASGTGSIANGDIGVELNEAPNNTIGGTSPAARNILSGNHGAGILLTGAATAGSRIEGNYIGTNSAGTAAVPNRKMGIGIGPSPGAVGARNNTIGGTTGTVPGGACTGSCNLISGNLQNGVLVIDAQSFNNHFVGNFIGTNAAGTGGIGNGLDGIGILEVPNTEIGDGTAAGRNVIASNGGNGVQVVGINSVATRISGNFIGESTQQGSLGNVDRGIVVTNGAIDAAITGNSIAFNGQGKLGIDLNSNGTVDQNDQNDPDGGANRLQNFPNIQGARNIGSTTKIGGQFNSTPNSNFRLDFFSNDGCNAGPPLNHGEGQNFLGSTDVSTDQFGNTAFGFTPGSQVPGNKYITATATRKVGPNLSDTSEFSRCILVNAAKPGLTNGANWQLRYYLTSGSPDLNFGYGFPSHLLMCAWDPGQPGVKLPVIFSGGAWYMRASYTTGSADNSFTFGTADSKPVCGDWDGDGTDSVGFVTPNGHWRMRNVNTAGAPDYSFIYGFARPIAGDWDGDGTDTPGIVENNTKYLLRNSNSAGPPDAGNFNFGNSSGTAVIGDWDGNGTDTIGQVGTNGVWSIRNNNSSGDSNGQFLFGSGNATPITW
ncbi:MAG TPA: hypothetical protein VFO38_04300 [Candidatus Saccharimonadales bacterium]|nr:hypothetical protein [Candidatus Saccharimonadales bacterium]